jgi:tetratricopeptide (TPR) repeat protein
MNRSHMIPMAAAALALSAASMSAFAQETASAVRKADRAVAACQADEARAALAPVKDKAGSDAAVAMALGRVLEQEQKASEASASYKKAVELATAAIAADAQNELAFYSLGVAQQRLKQYDKAAENLQKAGTLGFDGALVAFQLGATRAFQQRWSDAVAELSKAIGQDDGLAYAYYYRALAQDKLGKKDQLVLDMERFLKLAPKAPEAGNAAAILAAARR